jgi:hypothetical protein
MSKKQAVYELAIKINKALSVYMEVIDPVIDTFVNKWLSYGYEPDALLYVANECFKDDKRSLKEMDALIENLRVKGYVDLSSISDYFDETKKTDKFIEKLLLTAGVNRRPTPWDRENLAVWKLWNFSEEMILEAGKLASGKSSPIPYINGVLSNWKNNDVFTLDKITNIPQDKKDDQQEYNKEYERRRSIAISRAQRNMDTALSDPEYKAVYVRLNSIEKDLAFATVENDDNKINSLNIEKQTLNEKAKDLLNKIGLSLEDLSPKYSCKKCNDTGYVDGVRCDCF